MQQFLIVLAVVAGTFADSNLLLNPYGTYSNLPLTTGGLLYPGLPITTYGQPILKPIQTEIKPKKVEVQLKKIELVAEKTGCKNSFGDDVPCARTKRDAETDADSDSLLYINGGLTYGAPIATAGVYNAPLVTSSLYNAPITTSSLLYSNILRTPYAVTPLITSACKNAMGMAVPCARVKRDAETDADSDSLLYINGGLTYGAGIPTAGVYSAPLVTSSLYNAPITTSSLLYSNILRTPYAVTPLITSACKNEMGMAVPCARVKRDAETDADSDSLLYINGGLTYGAPIPTAGLYNAPLITSPLLRTLSTPIAYTSSITPEKRVIKVEQPVYKTVVEKVPVKPLCRNAFGLKVPCA